MTTRECRFCKQTHSLFEIPETGYFVCSGCWDIVAHIIGQYLKAQKLEERIASLESCLKRLSYEVNP